MDEKFVQQCFAEMSVAIGDVVGALAVALSRQVDLDDLRFDLEQAIKAISTPGAPQLSGKIAERALQALEAEAVLRRAQGTPPPFDAPEF